MAALCPVRKPMTRSEAQAACQAVRAHLDGCRVLLLDLYERQGWKALGYASWRACVQAEFDQGQSHVYRLLTAARLEQEVAPELLSGTIPESQLRPLVELESPAARQQAWQEASRGDQPRTAKRVQGVVDRIRSMSDADLAEEMERVESQAREEGRRQVSSEQKRQLVAKVQATHGRQVARLKRLVAQLEGESQKAARRALRGYERAATDVDGMG